MPNPYNLTTHNCSACPELANRRFCRMAPKAMAAVSKFTTFYPKGSLLYVEGETVEQPQARVPAGSEAANASTSSRIPPASETNAPADDGCGGGLVRVRMDRRTLPERCSASSSRGKRARIERRSASPA